MGYVKIFLVGMTFALVQALSSALIVMVCMAGLHNQAPEVPAWGYWACFWVALIFTSMAQVSTYKPTFTYNVPVK